MASDSGSSGTVMKGVGLVLVVGGAGVFYWGYQMSGSMTAELTKAVSGALPDAVMYRYIGGVVSCVLGLFLLTRRG